MGAVRQALRRALTASCPRSMFVTSGPPAGAIFLTFDDGPHPVHTPEVLDVLAAYRVRATFFVIGREVDRYPDLVRRIAAEGHEIGHHSYDHGDPEQVSAERLIEELHRTDARLRAVAGCSPRLVRPPHGKVTAAKLWQLWRRGYTVALWNVDPKDFACASALEVDARLAAREPQPGDVILLHDNQPHAAAILPALIARAAAHGLAFQRMSDMLRAGRAAA